MDVGLKVCLDNENKQSRVRFARGTKRQFFIVILIIFLLMKAKAHTFNWYFLCCFADSCSFSLSRPHNLLIACHFYASCEIFLLFKFFRAARMHSTHAQHLKNGSQVLFWQSQRKKCIKLLSKFFQLVLIIIFFIFFLENKIACFRTQPHTRHHRHHHQRHRHLALNLNFFLSIQHTHTHTHTSRTNTMKAWWWEGKAFSCCVFSCSVVGKGLWSD